MRILLLANLNSTHTIKWAKSLSKTHEVLIFGFSSPNPESQYELAGINFMSAGIKDDKTKVDYSLQKFYYFYTIPKIRKIIKNFKPDLVHAHYATSYGLIGALSGFHPYIISVWGSDVYDFPFRSIFHRILLKHNLSKADIILSTSNVMAGQVGKFSSKKILVTPFGIDLNKFHKNHNEKHHKKNELIIGTIKTLHEIYGIEYLIRAFKIVTERIPDKNLKLIIVGDGPLRSKLKKLSEELKINHLTLFAGKIPQDKVPEYLNIFDIYVALSLQESFGVAIIEAGACELPTVVSNVQGLTEVVEDGKTGYAVPPRDYLKAADAIEKLVLNENVRNEFGKNARKKIAEQYNWEKNVDLMNSIYFSFIDKY